MTGRVISLGQIIVDIAMRVPSVPRAGEDVFADDPRWYTGASFNTLQAVRQMGVDACWAGILGTGPMAHIISRTIQETGIRHIGPTDRQRDSGFCVAMTDQSAERTFVSTRGAEAYGGAGTFHQIHPSAADVVHMTGYTFVHETRAGLYAFLRRTLHRDFKAVFDPGPVLEDLPEDALRLLVDYRPIWSVNERELSILAHRLGIEATGNSDTFAYMTTAVARKLHAPVVARVGKGGAWVGAENTCAHHICGYPTHAVDTNGAGDCHTGVLCARLVCADSLTAAARIANAAASIAVSRPGPATCPTYEEALRAMQ